MKDAMDRLDAWITREPDYQEHYGACPMAEDARQPPFFRPTPIAINNYGDVVG